MTLAGAIARTVCVVISLSLSVLSAFVSPLAAIALLALATLVPLLWVIAPRAVTVTRIARPARLGTKPHAACHLRAVPAHAPADDHAIIDLVLTPTPRSQLVAEHSAS